MGFVEPSCQDTTRLSDFPARTMLVLALMLSVGAGLFFLLFHLLAWVAGWPGPFLWFGGPSRLLDITTGTLGIAASVFFFAALGIPVVKGLARFRFLNILLKVRR